MRVYIVDDEKTAIDNHMVMLNDFFPSIKIVGWATTVATASAEIINYKPDLVLLDIDLPDGTGFDIVKNIPDPTFKVIFITAFDQFALQAFRLSAVDYILKPVNPLEFREAVEKVASQSVHEKNQLELLSLLHNISENTEHDRRIVLKTNEDIHLVKTSELCRIESDGAYCHFFLENGKRITVSHNIRHYEELLSGYGFVRCHQSHMVNLRFVDRFQKSDGGMLALHNGNFVPVSSRKRDTVLILINQQGIC